MAYSALPAKIATDTLTLANYNAIKANFEASAIDIVTAKGQLAVATGADALTPLTVGANDSTLVPDSGQASGLAWQIQPAARVHNSALIDPATSSWVSLTFDSERFDTDASHSIVSNTGRLTVPTNGDGLYHFGGNVAFDTSGLSGGPRYVFGLRVLYGGASVLAQKMMTAYMSSFDVMLNIGGDYPLTAAGYLELQVYTAVDVNIVAADYYSPEFWFHWIRRA
jgi:hypothetical protein